MARERELRVKILGDSKGAEQALEKTEKASGKLTGALDKTGKASGGLASTLKDNLGAGAAIGAAAIAGLAVDAVGAASDLQEMTSATVQTFGEASDAILQFGEDAADSLGVSNRAALEAANVFGDLFQNVGVSQGNAAVFSQQLVRLAADLASFKNLDPGDVLARLQSGLVGETEPLRRLGIVINESTVRTKAMELGIASANGEVSEGAKVQARYALFLEKTDRAQGDLARTSDSLANKQRKANAQWEDTKARLGETLIPLAQQAAIAVDQLAGGVEETNKSFIRNFPLVSKVAEKFGLLKKEADPAAVAYQKLTAETARQAKVTQTLQEKEQRTADALKDAEGAAKGYASALRAVGKASEDLIGSQLNVADAVDALRDSNIETIAKERELAEAIKAHGRNSAEARNAAEAVEDARRAELRDIDALAKARRDEAIRAQEASGVVLEGVAKEEFAYRLYRDELIKLKDATAPGSPLRAHLEGVINSLPPPEVKFAVIADTQQADAALEKLRQQYNEFNRQNPAAVGPSLFGPVGAPAGTPAPSDNTRRRLFGRTFHSGGEVDGPNDVPAVLESGEYVIRRSAVQKLGRRTLDALNRFHTGGLVGPKRGTRPILHEDLTPKNSPSGAPLLEFLGTGGGIAYYADGSTYTSQGWGKDRRVRRVAEDRVPKRSLSGAAIVDYSGAGSGYAIYADNAIFNGRGWSTARTAQLSQDWMEQNARKTGADPRPGYDRFGMPLPGFTPPPEEKRAHPTMPGFDIYGMPLPGAATPPAINFQTTINGQPDEFTLALLEQRDRANQRRMMAELSEQQAAAARGA